MKSDPRTSRTELQSLNDSINKHSSSKHMCPHDSRALSPTEHDNKLKSQQRPAYKPEQKAASL